MINLVLDADAVVDICSENSNDLGLSEFFDLVQKRNWKIWLYTAQMMEILSRIDQEDKGSDLQGDRSRSSASGKAFDTLKKNSQWLATLTEDTHGMDDADPMGIALVRASARLGKETFVVTSNPIRLNRGHPFIELNTLFEIEGKRRIDFVDLENQQDCMRANLESSLHRVLHHRKFVMGPEIETLESRLANYVDVDHCVCVSSGTDALLIALMALGVGVGDEVITTPFTFFASVETIMLLGATPVYIDIDPRLYTLDPTQLESVITDRTKAILPVSLYGQCADMDYINKAAAANQISVIEDAAQSFGATYKGRKSCGLSQIGCTSFFPSKPLGAYGDAGACFTQNPDLAARMREVRDHGQSARYQHVRIGINGRMDTLQAAVLLAKMDLFDGELMSRARVARQYSNLLKSTETSGQLTLPQVGPHNFSSWAQYTVEVGDRHQVQTALSGKGIPTAIHYPDPVYRQSVASGPISDCPVAERAAKHVLSLPMHPYLSLEDQEHVVASLTQVLNT